MSKVDKLKCTGILLLNLPQRPYLALRRANINNLRDLTNMSAEELAHIRGLGPTGVGIIRKRLRSRGLCLSGERAAVYWRRLLRMRSKYPKKQGASK